VVASLAGLSLPLAYSKGTDLVLAGRVSEAYLARCRWPSDGDVIVPHASASLWGTTSGRVDHPGDTRVDRAEIVSLTRDLAALIPGAERARVLRAYAGVRPLAVETAGGADDRSLSRDFSLRDHQAESGLGGLVSVVGGKMCTCRLMAEKTGDLVMRLLGLSGPCQTRTVPLPSTRRAEELGRRRRLRLLTGAIGERDRALICECEAVNRGEVAAAIEADPRADLDSLRTATRLGMGPCQGAGCARKALGMLVESGRLTPAEAPAALSDFLERRFRGARPVARGAQLKQTLLTLALYGPGPSGPMAPEGREAVGEPDPMSPSGPMAPEGREAVGEPDPMSPQGPEAAGPDETRP
jgi:glycerol-3-phosphate dehydrogenase